MAAWHRDVMSGWWQDVGAGVATASTALVTSFLYSLVLMVIPLQLSADAQYWAGYAPQFAFVAGLVIGTFVWRRVMSRASTPEQGAFAGSVLGLIIAILVPILAAMYVLLFPVLLSVVTGQGLHYALQLYPAPLWAAVGAARTIATAWSPLVGVLLILIGALFGWTYQRRRRFSGY
ncbi:hypothetical protein [Haloferax chudinovii]|uniref:Uncharacterized protein n=1 Tax=Haloferax chudinovii TaxID=1109010 RepID=A0ABD5XGH2_9EURY